ncbi:MAG TPA: RDD family protein [Streptosporangiaceae bacterium]
MAGVVTGEAVVLDVRVARLASRVLARFIDLVIQIVLLALVTLLAFLLSETLDAALIRAIVVVCVGGVIVGYPVVWETLTRGRSPGKMALGLRVVSSDWSPVRFRQSLFRALAEVVEVWMLSGVPAVVVSLLTENAQRLGDIFAGTFVIQERMPRRTAPPAEMPPHLAAWAHTLDLSRLPDEIALTARSYLSRRTELDPLAAEEMGHRVANAIAAHITPPPPPATDTTAYLSAVLAERRTRATPPPTTPTTTTPSPTPPTHPSPTPPPGNAQPPAEADPGFTPPS